MTELENLNFNKLINEIREVIDNYVYDSYPRLKIIAYLTELQSRVYHLNGYDPEWKKEWDEVGKNFDKQRERRKEMQKMSVQEKQAKIKKFL